MFVFKRIKVVKKIISIRVFLLVIFLGVQSQAEPLSVIESYQCTAIKEKNIFLDNILYNQKPVIVKLAGNYTYMPKDNLIVNGVKYKREGTTIFGNNKTRVEADWNEMQEEGMLIIKEGKFIDSTTVYSCIVWTTKALK